MIKYRLTPWDTRVFGFKTAEITQIEYQDDALFYESWITLEKELTAQNIKFVYTRIPSEQKQLKFSLQQAGFYFCETSLLLSKNKVRSFEKEKLPPLILEEVTIQQIPEIKDIAKSSFHYGRFHEDPNISSDLASDRYVHWIDDLVDSNQKIYAALMGSKMVGFCVEKTSNEENSTTLVLAGVAHGKEIFALSLWNEIIYQNKVAGKSKIEATISASNIGVYNIYAHFGFKTKACYFGFHKYL